MKKRILFITTILMLSLTMAGCSVSSNTTDNSEIDKLVNATIDSSEIEEVVSDEISNLELENSEIVEPVEHSHSYTETLTEATCNQMGTKIFTCECGDTYSEELPIVDHAYDNYVSNNDATYLADGTETSKCTWCEETNTRTVEGSKLQYTYTDLDKTMYAQNGVNVRTLPTTDGEKVGFLDKNAEVHVSGQCIETSWYRIDYNGTAAYVSNNYLGDAKVVEPVLSKADQLSYRNYPPSENPYTLPEGWKVTTVEKDGFGNVAVWAIRPDGVKVAYNPDAPDCAHNWLKSTFKYMTVDVDGVPVEYTTLYCPYCGFELPYYRVPDYEYTGYVDPSWLK